MVTARKPRKPKKRVSKMSYIYGIYSKKTNKWYIGYTSRSPSQRYREHVKIAFGGDKRILYEDMHKICKAKTFPVFLKRAKKYFLLKTLQRSTRHKFLFANREEYYVSKYNSYRKGYNNSYDGK